MISYKEKSIKDNLYLGLTLQMPQIEKLIKESRTRSTGLWRDPEIKNEKYSIENRYSYKNFNLQQVFETLDCSNYSRLSVDSYHNLDNWLDYCKFLSHNPSIKKPKILKVTEWNGVGIDEED